MIAQFALRLMFGMSLMWCLMPRREVTSGFFRIQMLVVLGLSVLAALTSGQLSAVETALITSSTGMWICVGTALVAYVGSVLWMLDRRGGGNQCVFLIAAASAVVLIARTSSGELETSAAILQPVSEVASAAILGSAMVGMLLGHWYLTAPTMSIAPLSTLNWIFGASAALRLICSLAGILVAWEATVGSPQWGTVHSVWLVLRWIGGIIGPLVLAVMVWRILKYRNTQSATGVLFVGVILTFIGEMTATLLYGEWSVPL